MPVTLVALCPSRSARAYPALASCMSETASSISCSLTGESVNSSVLVAVTSGFDLSVTVQVMATVRAVPSGRTTVAW